MRGRTSPENSAVPAPCSLLTVMVRTGRTSTALGGSLLQPASSAAPISKAADAAIGNERRRGRDRVSEKPVKSECGYGKRNAGMTRSQ
jgi:hypothetical protein